MSTILTKGLALLAVAGVAGGAGCGIAYNSNDNFKTWCNKKLNIVTQAQYDKVLEDNKSLSEQVVMYQTLLAEEQSKVQDLNNQVTTLSAEKTDLQNQIADKNALIADLQSQLENNNNSEEEIEELQNQIELLQQEKETLQNQLTEKDTELTQAQLDLVEAQTRIAELEAELEELRQQSSDNETVTITSESYFTFFNGTLIRFSTKGQELHDNGELTELVIPSTYVSDGTDTREVELTFDNYNELMAYCDENVENTDIYPITIVNEDLVINSYDEFRSFYNTMDFSEQINVDIQVLVQEIVPVGEVCTVTSIGESAFSGCDYLEIVIIPETITNIGGCAFEKCNALTNITIPNSVTSVGAGIFSDCMVLEKITIPGSISDLGSGMFARCSALSSVTISEGVENIGHGTFDSCTSLTNITIPSSVTTIGYSTFYECTSLESITILAETPPTLADIASIPETIDLIYVPDASVEAYKTAENWSHYADIIQAIE